MSQTATTPPPPGLTGPVSLASRVADFGDWMSPILVKELRQGLKTRLFVTAFILVQVVMTLLLGMRLIAEDNSVTFVGGALDGLLWTCLTVVMLILMPFRGLTTISEEVKANTLDLVGLTRMGSFRIVAGKWLAIVVQTLLLAVAVLPYAVLRYFFGQVDIVNDLLMLGRLISLSCVITALAVYLSTAPQAARSLLIVVAVPFAFVTFSFVFSRSMGGMGGGGLFSSLGAELLLLVATLLYTPFFLLEAEARIAPQAQQHPAKRRALVLLALAIGLLAAIALPKDDAGAVLATFLPMILWGAIMAMTEQASELPVVYMPWEKAGVMGRVAGTFLHPGWGTGVLYVLVLSLGYGAGMAIIGEDATDVVFLGMTAILTPALILSLLPGYKNRILLYILIQVLMALWWVVLNVTGDAIARPGQALLPTSAFFMKLDLGSQPDHGAMTIAYGVCAAVLLLVAASAVKEFTTIRRMHGEARKILNEIKTAA